MRACRTRADLRARWEGTVTLDTWFPSGFSCPFFQRARTLTAEEIMKWKNPPAKPEERPIGEVGRPRTRARGALGRGATYGATEVGGRDKKGGRGGLRLLCPAALAATTQNAKRSQTEHDKT